MTEVREKTDTGEKRIGQSVMRRARFLCISACCICFCCVLFAGCETGNVREEVREMREEMSGFSSFHARNDVQDDAQNQWEVLMENKRVIYLAGGCFWGVEGYFKQLHGVLETTAGYANGESDQTDYHSLTVTDHAETVKIEYDRSRISLEEILLHYFRVIDPTSVNRQGGDVGRQYRTGIYYSDVADRPVIDKIMESEREKHGKIAVETEELRNFAEAEEYHQDYLDKNPNGYCHINLATANTPLFRRKFELPSPEKLKDMLTEEEYHIIVNSGTEMPHSSPLNREYRKGIYVDKVTKMPLFASKDKFEAGCGWPSFSKPILSNIIVEVKDTGHGMIRTEVRSKSSDAHLGHVFGDGPKEGGGLRYCINGASLEFVPYEEMRERGYEEYLPLCE